MPSITGAAGAAAGAGFGRWGSSDGQPGRRGKAMEITGERTEKDRRQNRQAPVRTLVLVVAAGPVVVIVGASAAEQRLGRQGLQLPQGFEQLLPPQHLDRCW